MRVSSIQNNYDGKSIAYNYTDSDYDIMVNSYYSTNDGRQRIIHTLHEDNKHNIVSSVYEKETDYELEYEGYDYTYDGLNRLIEESIDRASGTKTVTYTYDAGGNILSKTDGNSTTTYHYENEWKDQLSRVTIDGVDKYFTYDANGNPTRYMTNSATSTVNMEWTRGRMLSRCNGTSFTYYANGLRKSKINSNLTQTYYYAGDTLIGEVWSNGLQITYIYGKMGIEAMIVKSGNEERIFKYVTDCLGSVIEIKELVDGALESRLKCSYDAWGNRTVSGGTSITIDGYSILMSNLNPFYYRGYYYDIETKFYYLQTRYYDPALGRFINPDTLDCLAPESINGLNLYCYCMNNPIMYADPSGHLPEWAAWLISGAAIVGGIVLCATGVGGILGGVLIGAGAGSLINGYVTEANGGDFTAGYIGGAISGALCGVGAGLGGMAFAAASEVANLACIGYMALGVTASFAGGFAGNLAGTVYTSWHNSGFKSVDIDWGETLATSAIMGSLNILAGMGSAMSSIAGSMGRVATDVNSKFALRFLAGLIAGGTEAAYDLTSYLIGKLISAF